MDVTTAITKRRSIRKYADTRLSDEIIDKILWAGQQYPSAGKKRPLKIIAVTEEEPKQILARAAGQEFVGKAPVVFVILADYQKTCSKYGRRGDRYVCMEAGHAAQNMLLLATELGLAACPVGAFSDTRVAQLLGTDDSPLYLIPAGMVN